MSGIAMRYDFAYIGPSWAVQSYSSPLGLEDKIKINIGVMFSEEFGYGLGHNKKLWLPRMGVSNFWCVDEIKNRNIVENYPGIPIIWLMCEPLGDCYYHSKEHDMTWPHYKEDEILDNGFTVEQWVEKLLCGGNWKETRETLLHMALKRMNDLGTPIGLIGSHSDISEKQVEKYENITVIEPSWQRVLAEHCELEPLEEYIGVDFYHQTIKIFLKDKEVMDHMRKHNMDKYKYTPSGVTKKLMSMIMSKETKIDWESGIDGNLINTVYDVYNHWDIFEQKKIWNWVHPNIRGNKIFYDKIKYKIKEFIDDNKE